MDNGKKRQTKPFNKFDNNSVHLDADVELMDVIHRLNREERLSSGDNGKIFDEVNMNNHPVLAGRKVSKHNRVLAINTLRRTVYEAYVKNIYESMTIYFKNIVKVIVKTKNIDYERLIDGNEIKLTGVKIFELGDFNRVIEYIANTIYRQLENERSSKLLIKKINTKLGISVDDKIINEAIPYIEMRHIVVHNEGKIDDKLIKALECIGDTNLKVGELLKIDYEIIKKMREAITSLIREFDEKIVEKELVSKKNLHLSPKEE